MVLVVCDVEAHNLLVFAFLLLHVAQLQATVFNAVIGLNIRRTGIFQDGVDVSAAIGDRNLHDMTFFPALRIEAAGTQEDVQHIVDAVVKTGFLPAVLTAVVLTVLAQVALPVRVGVEHLVDGVVLALARSLTEVEWGKVLAAVAEQRVAQHEHLVHLIITARGQAGTKGRLARVTAEYCRHRGRTGFHPHEFPIIIQVITQELTTFESGVRECALRLCASAPREKHDERQQVCPKSFHCHLN